MIRLSAKYLLLPLLLLFINGASGQNMSVNGRFNTRYFAVSDFGSSAQIWAGAQGSDGKLYFGNRQDILIYNGIEWKKIKMDRVKTAQKQIDLVKETKVREIVRGSDDILYVGRENNFGYIAYSDSGAACYYPLHLGFGKNPIGNVWNIYETNNQRMLFVSENALFYVKDKKVTPRSLPASFNGFISKTSSRFGNGILIVYRRETTDGWEQKYLFVELISGRTREIFLPEHIHIRNIRGSFEVNGKWYLMDISGNIYGASFEGGKINWDTQENTAFSELEVALSTPNYISRHGNHLYIGTEAEGVIIADLQGRIIRRIDFYDGLENLNVFKLFHDDEGNLWLCLDNGIQLFETSSPITFFKKDQGIASLPEALVFEGEDVLVGLHSDIFGISIDRTHRKFVTKDVLQQDIYDLDAFNTSQGRRTLVIAYNGIYEYFPKENRSEPIVPAYAYSMRQDPKNKDVVYVTLEAGIAQLKLLPNGKWEYTELRNNVGGSTFDLAAANGKVYFGVAENGLGIYDVATKKFHVVRDPKRRKGESSSYTTEWFQGQLFVETTNGLKVLSKDEKTLIPFPKSKEFFGTSKNDYHRMINMNDEQLWIVIYHDLGEGKFEIETGWLEKRGNNWEWVKWPLAALKKEGIISSICKSPSNEVWLGGSGGLFVLNLDAVRKYRNHLKVAIDRFEAGGKILRYDVFKAVPLDALSYSQNSFRVVFHANSFSSQGQIEYRIKLEGFNDEWSEWSDQYYKDFQKIGEGNYILMIQARNGFGIESEVLKYEITILPPWYRTIWAYVLYIIALIVLIFVIVRLSTRRVKRQNQRLEAIVQERTREIAEQNHQLEQQKTEITQKTTDILDSIQYAKRIQSTILPAESRLNELFHEHFVFYRPKDIVSGDFYWAREVQDKTIFSAVDCTGHGVPGSLVSIVGNNGLLRAVNEFKLTEPNEILDKLREIVVSAFRSEGQLDVKDGMDIALCSIDYETGMLKFAGANNECVIIRNGQVFELKPDKQPIGQFVDAKPFNQCEFQLQDNDCIYLYTDGYVDQFGGEKVKKLKSRPFKTMLTSISHLPMNEQFNEIQHVFDTWKGDLEQVDDVCVFGVRYKKK